jgi:predicted nucleic acid-binding Zn ribbon protein
MADNETYHGTGFTGRRPGERSPQEVLEWHSALQAGPSAPAQHQGNVAEPPPPEMHCLSCNSRAQWLPNGQLWCPRCQTALEVQDKNKRAGAAVAAVITLILLVLLGIAWYEGTFDRFLAQFGLNAQPCAQNFFGTIMCGAELEKWCRENYDAELNGEACDAVLN